MMKRSLPFVLTSLVAISIASAGCGRGEKKAEVPNEETLAARVGDWSITRDYLQKYIDKLPDQQKRKYDSSEGRADLANRFIQEELFYREAKKKNLIDEKKVQKQLEDAKRRILIQAYFDDFVKTKAEPTEDEIHDYYESHEDVYTSLPVVRAQQIFSKSKEKLEGLKERVVEGGEKFTTLAHKYSEDKLTSNDGGDLGYFNPGGYIRGVGYSKAFSDTVFKMEKGKVYGPFHWERGWSLVRVNEKRPAELRPYSEVRDEIKDKLTQENLENARHKVVAEISKNYDVRNYMQEYYMATQRSPKELFAYAQTSKDPRERVKTFQEIVDKFPDSEYAPQALFMVGFVYAEELKDLSTADHTFTRLVNRYPDSDVAQSARWMLENMGKPLPKFQNLDDLNKKIKEQSQSN